MKEKNNKVGKVFETVEDKEKEFDINDEVCPRIEKYPDLPEDELIPIEYTHKRKGKINQDPDYQYLINKKGEIKSGISGKLMKYSCGDNKYPGLSIFLRKGERFTVDVHILVANTFLINPNSDRYEVINHIDHDPKNNRLSNLEFITKKGNSNESSGKKLPVSEDKRTIYIASELETGEEVYRFTSLNIPEQFSINGILGALTSRGNGIYKGYKWSRENVHQVKDGFYKKIGFSGNFDDYEWLEHPLYDDLYVCKEGFIRRKFYRDKYKRHLIDIVLGFVSSDGYVKVNFTNKNKRICTAAHRIIMEFTLKRKLKDDELVDHINTNRLDNSFDNLRATDQLGNMNNEQTKSNLSSKVCVLDLFGDIVLYNVLCLQAHEFIFGKVDKQMCHIADISNSWRVCNGKYICISIKKLSEEKLFDKLSRVFYIVDENKQEIVKICLSLEEIGRSGIFKRDIKTITRYYKNNKVLDGFRILKIKEAKDVLIANEHLNILKELQTEKDTTNKNQIEEK